MIYIGIDPGVGGGIAAVDDRGVVVHAARMPLDDENVLGVLGDLGRRHSRSAAVLEFVRSSPQMGVVSAFHFGLGYGGLRMALRACGIPFNEIVPRKWQPDMGVHYQKKQKGDFVPSNKNVSKARAQELFPDLKVTHAIADALLLAAYCRRIHA